MVEFAVFSNPGRASNAPAIASLTTSLGAGAGSRGVSDDDSMEISLSSAVTVLTGAAFGAALAKTSGFEP
jgi:hypothetical protein